MADDLKGRIHVALTQTEVPRIVEKQGKEWVDFGEKNNAPQEFIDLGNSSALHNAILVNKAAMIAGKGLTYVKDGLTVEDQSKVEQFITAPNEEETLYDIVKKVAIDHVFFGALSLETIFSKGGNKVNVNHIDTSLLRSGKFNKKRKIENYFYSEDWMQWRKPECQPIPISAFDLASKEKQQLLYVKNYRPGQKYYGLPDWIAARQWIELDSEIALRHLSSVKNGMTPSLWINFKNGVPSPEEQRKIYRDIKANYVGAKHSSKFIVTYSDGGDTSPDITKMEYDTALDQLYIVLNAQTQENIFSGHRITSPMLFGRETAGKLGASKELENAYKIFDKTVITPAQVLIERTLNKILKAAGLRGGIKIEKSDVIEFTFEDNILQTIMTTNEMRRKINLPDLTPEQLAELKGTTQATAPTQNAPLQ